VIRTKLMKHQKLICDFMKDKNYSAIFADYGTGKTLCVLSHVEHMERARKILIVSSKTSVQSTWPDEIELHTNFRYVHLLGTRRKKQIALRLGLRASMEDGTSYAAESTQPVFFLINFDGVRNIYDELVQCGFDLIVVDESTKIKSPRADRTKILWAIGRTTKRRIIMTGFPITENLGEIYSQIKFLDHGKALGSGYYAFLEKYFYRAGFKRKPKTGAEKKIFGLIKPFSIRVSNEVLDLPPKVYRVKKVGPTSVQKKLLDDLNQYFSLELGKIKIDTQYIFTLINKSLEISDGFVKSNWYKKIGLERDRLQCYKCGKTFNAEKYDGKKYCLYCGHKGYLEVLDTNKDEAIVDLIDDIDPFKNKIVVWAMFRFSVKKLKKLFTSMEIPTLTLTGTTEDPNTVVRKFQYEKKYRILLATQKKASESITLTKAKHAIYYSSPWSYDLRSNSEARIRRKGSEKHSHIMYTDILIKNSVDEIVYNCLRRKGSLVGDLKKQFRTISMRR